MGDEELNIPEIELIIRASTIDGRRKGACLFCQVVKGLLATVEDDSSLDYAYEGFYNLPILFILYFLAYFSRNARA